MVNPVARQLIRCDEHAPTLKKSQHVFNHRPLPLVVVPLPEHLPIRRHQLGFKPHRSWGIGAKATPDPLLIDQHLANQCSIYLQLFCHQHGLCRASGRLHRLGGQDFRCIARRQHRHALLGLQPAPKQLCDLAPRADRHDGGLTPKLFDLRRHRERHIRPTGSWRGREGLSDNIPHLWRRQRRKRDQRNGAHLIARQFRRRLRGHLGPATAGRCQQSQSHQGHRPSLVVHHAHFHNPKLLINCNPTA